jgi:ribosomal protein S18 acetylase RimI-like enzyme
MILSHGIRPEDRTEAARLYWQAFGGKLGRVMGPGPKAERFIAGALGPDHAICAHDSSGRLIGVAGFKTARGALVDGSFRDMAQIYGPFGALWRLALLGLLEGEVDNDRFLMDGIVVDVTMRGRGVGTALLDAISREAAARGYAEVRLDVVDSNPRARALYERHGFEAQGDTPTGWLRHVFGFRSATTMVRQLH